MLRHHEITLHRFKLRSKQNFNFSHPIFKRQKEQSQVSYPIFCFLNIFDCDQFLRFCRCVCRIFSRFIHRAQRATEEEKNVISTKSSHFKCVSVIRVLIQQGNSTTFDIETTCALDDVCETHAKTFFRPQKRRRRLCQEQSWCETWINYAWKLINSLRITPDEC